MKGTISPLVIANWKLNPESLKDAKELFVAVRQKLRSLDTVQVVVAPPYPYISDIARLSPSGRIAIAAQDAWPEATGSETGAVSVPMVVSCGASYVIVGHSERRARGEDDALVAQKVRSVLRAKQNAVVCVGESVRDDSGDFYSVVEEQVASVLAVCNRTSINYVVIAYEPVWAIGSGRTPTTEDIQEMRLFIEKCIAERVSRSAAKKVPILYGGSVNDKNAATLFTDGMVDGFLVGGASLRPDTFAALTRRVEGAV
jgi:triosephosphate isomerase